MPNRQFSIIISLQAESDLIEIFNYILYSDGIEQANSIHFFLEEKIKSLAIMPERGKYLFERLESKIHNNYRELSAYPWRIFYEINDIYVDIIAVLDGRRDIKEVLKERLLKN